MWLIGLHDNPVVMGLMTIISNFKLALVLLHVHYTSGRKANGELFSLEERTFWFCFIWTFKNPLGQKWIPLEFYIDVNIDFALRGAKNVLPNYLGSVRRK
jgi:hypothetical protein